ncbi:MAG: hypothetical protein LLG04_16520 [Parachlamydia sp.]|nr:hypothetical protein [Parachlamydia sp.]
MLTISSSSLMGKVAPKRQGALEPARTQLFSEVEQSRLPGFCLFSLQETSVAKIPKFMVDLRPLPEKSSNHQGDPGLGLS